MHAVISNMRRLSALNFRRPFTRSTARQAGLMEGWEASCKQLF